MDEFRTYCMNKKGVTESFPFNQSVIVLKVMNKMFALGNVDLFEGMNLKCDPDEAAILRDIFPGVIPAYHMNKALWNTIILDGSIPRGEIERMIDNSFKLVVGNMSKKMQASILLHL